MKNKALAKTPPMGWNSWDCYGASVREDEVLGNAQYMADHLKAFGWDTVVVDIQWSEPTADSADYHPFAPLVTDGYGRLMPAENRFPSAAGGRGFKPLADQVHALGLKFGIHIMRGIPRQAVAANTPILGSDARAADIADQQDVCLWNTDMYGVDPDKPGAQAYYDSLLALYASWEVDFIKCDDMSAPRYHAGEVELLRSAINRCGRDIILSLSPGDTPLEAGEHVRQHASMWRISNDFWDSWEALKSQFVRLNKWTPFMGEDSWPDADMLPLGQIGLRSHGGQRPTHFTRDEQLTMMSLWSIARSPLMMGGEMRLNDAWTLSLLTNADLIYMLNHSHGNAQLFHQDPLVIWGCQDDQGRAYRAFFNLGEETFTCDADFFELPPYTRVVDLWSQQARGRAGELSIPAHGVKLLRLE